MSEINENKNTHGVRDIFEENECFDHPILSMVLVALAIIARERGDEDDGGDGVKAVNPLLPLIPLSADVVHYKFNGIDGVLITI
tara:strand:- start:256 stop:507 length:252 start_codon:yes stop_codon:yes gene_type:complete